MVRIKLAKNTLDHKNLKDSYDNDEENENIAKNFLVPCLNSSEKYRRITYSFSSAAIEAWAGSLSYLISEKIKIEIFCDMSWMVSSMDEQTKRAFENSIDESKRRKIILKYQDQITSEAWGLDQGKKSHKSRAIIIDWLMATGQMEFKFAWPKKTNNKDFTRDPIFHKKMGYFKLNDGSLVAFKGSWNESLYGSTENGEECDVFSSEKPADQNRLKKTIEKVDLHWEKGVPGKFDVYPLSKKVLKKIKDRAPKERPVIEDPSTVSSPVKSPESSSSQEKNDFELYEHQKAVINDWHENSNKGLIVHATGSGKTISAIFAIKSLVENGRVALIVVPSKFLQNQWYEELKEFIPMVKILQVGQGASAWKDNLSSFTSLTSAASSPRVVLAILNTASKDNFIEKLNQENLIFVADEVHRLGSKKFRNIFKIDADYRLGLSATPERFRDEEGTKAILDYFENKLEPIYEIKDALGKALVHYDYHVHECLLSFEECEQWNDMSEKISKAWNANGQEESDGYVALLSQRAKIAKKAESKISKATSILQENYDEGQRWVVYCEEEVQMEEFRIALKEEGIDSMKFYSEMPLEAQKGTLEKFENFGGIILSIKMLDEGVDIPSIDHALIIASDQNPRQYIQRRGRVLRKSDNKQKAVIHDLIITPPSSETGKVCNLTKTEILRAINFNKNAINEMQTKNILDKLAKKYNLDLNQIEEKDDFNNVEEDLTEE